MATENLEELIECNRFHICEREKEILRRFSQVYPELVNDVMNEVNARKAKALRGWHEWDEEEDEGKEDTDVIDIRELSTPFLVFLNNNLDVFAALPDGLGELVVAKLIRGADYHEYEEFKKLQKFFEHLAAFCRADNGYSLEGKKDVLYVATDSPGPDYKDFVMKVVDLYSSWQTMLHTGNKMDDVGALLLQEFALQYRIPVPDGAGRLRSTHPEPMPGRFREFMVGHIDRDGYYDLKLLHMNIVRFSGSKIQDQYSTADIRRFLLEKIEAKKPFDGVHNIDDLDDIFNELSELLSIESEAGNFNEAVECAQLNRRLERTGYRIKRKLLSSTFKEVYAATDEYGTKLVLKSIINEKVRRVLAERGGTIDEMVQKEIKSSPFRMLHTHVSPTVQLKLPDGEVCILEKRYDMTLEEFFKGMCSVGGVFGRKPAGLESVDVDEDKWRSWLDQEKWVEIGSYGTKPREGRQYPAFETGVPTQGRDYVLLEPYLTKILRLALQAAQGMEYCHEKGIVHSDIKPDNIGVLIEGGEESALISDFGVATYDLPAVGGDALGGGLGRVYTKAPELFEKGSHPSKRTDAWSFGATLFYLFTGRYPFSDSVCNYNSPEEKWHYLEKVHRIVMEAAVEKELKNAVEQYVPRAVEISSLQKCAIFDVGESLMMVLDMCFWLNRKPWFGRDFAADYSARPFMLVREKIEKLQGMVEEKRKEVYESTLPPF